MSRSPGCWPRRRHGWGKAVIWCSTGHHLDRGGWSSCAGRISQAWRLPMREPAAGPVAQLEHAAVFYATDDEYLDEVLGFVEAGLGNGDLVFVAVPGPKLSLLREHLDDHADQVTFADMTQMGANPAWIIPRVRAVVDASPGRRVSYVGEPIWETRSAEELQEA